MISSVCLWFCAFELQFLTAGGSARLFKRSLFEKKLVLNLNSFRQMYVGTSFSAALSRSLVSKIWDFNGMLHLVLRVDS